MMLFRSIFMASLAASASADFSTDFFHRALPSGGNGNSGNGGGGNNKNGGDTAGGDSAFDGDNACDAPDWVPIDGNQRNTGLRCCAKDYGDKGHFASCETSSCVENFNAKNLNCFNYGSSQHPLTIKGDITKAGGSNNCPYQKQDKAICDTTYYNMLNGQKCRENALDAVHCLGKVKCQSGGITPGQTRKSKSDGTDGTVYNDISDIDYGTCVGGGYLAGQDCFYNGASENFKVCLGDASALTAADEAAQDEQDGFDDTVEERAPIDPPTEEDITTTHSFTQGDPHFKTHGGEMYDFHGGCDMVLLDNPEYQDGLGMHIQIRTKIETWWSYVASAAIRIGDDTLEVVGGNQHQWLYINGVLQDTSAGEDQFKLIMFAGKELRFKVARDRHEAHIYVGGGQKIFFKTYNNFVKVDLAAKGSQHYTNSLGLLGRFPDGERVGRDGVTFIEDVNVFGQEWQVKAEEPQLFHTYEGEGIVKPGQMCVMPSDTVEKQQLRKRRLETGISMATAEAACAHLESAEMRKACAFDIVATQDVNMASVW